jgi:hypothetical protein
MTDWWPNLRKLAASLVLGVLVIASVVAPVCPACSKLELPSAKHISLSSAGQNGAPNCDKDGCSCCGFHIVAAPSAPTLEQTASSSVVESLPVQLLEGSPFTLYHPPRR